MYRILVPLDGSRFAEQALPIACGLARCANAELELMHVLDFVHEVPGVDTPDEEWLHTTARNDADRYLEHCGSGARKSSQVATHSTVLEGSPAEKIQDEAARWKADLIVMATHGHGAFDRAWIGSVADALVRESRTPVVLVRAGAKKSKMKMPGSFKHVLVPLDGSRLAEQAIEPAVRFTRCSKARLTLLRVVRPIAIVSEAFESTVVMPPISESVIIDRQQDARDYVTRITHSLEPKVDEVAGDVVVAESSEAAEIMKYAKAHEVDLIALATHGRSGLKRLVLGSVADKLIRGSPVPVLVVRPSG
jgi:nucleotide-binding universal stress UspA family protein